MKPADIKYPAATASIPLLPGDQPYFLGLSEVARIEERAFIARDERCRAQASAA